jgi:hypothetical protein
MGELVHMEEIVKANSSAGRTPYVVDVTATNIGIYNRDNSE